VCISCIVEITGGGSRTQMAFIFAELPRVGDFFAFDEPGGCRCEVVVCAIDLGPMPFEDRSGCATLLVRRIRRLIQDHYRSMFR
jgi:hypothetical protein